jgi:precorrin-6A/cobalt-precorrin-6A reductase
MRLLILGGTTEASGLALRLAGRADVEPILSLAGRTRNPLPPPIPFRVGGFGGVDGLRRFLAERRIDAVIDATHPFAARMTANAALACRAAAIPLARLTRPPWRRQAGDRWLGVPDLDAAARAIGDTPRRVFLTIGGVQLAAFAAAPQHHYVVRAIERPAAIAGLPSHELILARGPFGEAAETALLRDARIDVVVTKNSGGSATEAKLAAARALGIAVIMIERPADDPIRAGEPGNAIRFPSIDDVLAWIEAVRPARLHRPPP